jgi:hypothetical protein
MKITTRLLSATLLAVALAGTACGGSGNGGSTQAGGASGTGSPSVPATPAATTTPAPATTTAPPQVIGTGACTLVTQDEAAAALGMPVPAGSATTASFPIEGVGTIQAEYCSFGSEVLLARFDLGSAGSTLFATYRQSLTSESDYQEVSGVGDEAFFAKGQLAVRQSDTGLIVDVGQNTGSISGEQEREKSLALAALARL